MYKDIVQNFEQNADPELAGPMKAYLKDKFELYGIKSPLRKEISKPFMAQAKTLTKDEVFDLVEQLWNRPERELHYFAQEFLFRAKRQIKDKMDIEFLQWMALTNSWWETIDFISPKLMKIYFEQFPEMRNKKVDEWIASDNIWLQRCAILIHLHQKDQVDMDYMFDTILRLCHTKEFFINKAIGWVLREHAKREEKIIVAFVMKNEKSLSALSRKEALKLSSIN